MYGLMDHEASRRYREEIRREVAEDRLAKGAREDHESSPYVMRGLSWELARYPDAEGFPASASAPPNSASG